MHLSKAPSTLIRAFHHGSVRSCFVMRNRIIRYAALISHILLLGACAQVHVTPLEANGKPKADAQEGVRYYLPKPYLLVAEVPVESASSSTDLTKDAQGKITEQKSTIKQNDPSGPDNMTGGPPSSTGNTSFGMFTKQYGIKLIYLPDYSQPMAIHGSPGLFGSSQMKPTLQDGWMLTALDATGDSKVSDTLSAVASIIGSIKGGGSLPSGTSAKVGGSELINGTTVVTPTLPVLSPGLYELQYDEKGVLTRVKVVAYFCHGKISDYSEAANTPQPCK